MKKILLAIMALATLTIAGCRKNEDTNPENDNKEQPAQTNRHMAVGDFIVAASTPAEYSERDTIYVEIIDANKLDIILNQVRFSSHMPIKTTLVLPNLNYRYDAQSKDYDIDGNAVTPLFNGEPYTQYIVNNIDADFNLTTKYIEFESNFVGERGEMTVEFVGQVIY